MSAVRDDGNERVIDVDGRLSARRLSKLRTVPHGHDPDGATTNPVEGAIRPNDHVPVREVGELG